MMSSDEGDISTWKYMGRAAIPALDKAYPAKIF